MSPNKELIERLEGRLTATKEEMSAASLKLSILVKTFRQSQLYLTSTRAANLTGEREGGRGEEGNRGSVSETSVLGGTRPVF